jgi:hypothetical protein
MHAGGFNLGLLLRALLGAGTPRGFRDRGGRVVAAVLDLIHIARELLAVKVISWVHARSQIARTRAYFARFSDDSVM